jgi:hypothetical protein
MLFVPAPHPLEFRRRGEPDGDKFHAEWADAAGLAGSAMFGADPAAVNYVARNQAGGLPLP